MNHSRESYIPPTSHDRLKPTRRGRVVGAIAAVSLAITTGAGLKVAYTPHEIGRNTVGLQPGDGGIKTVCGATREIMEKNDLYEGPYSLPADCVYAGQRVYTELNNADPAKLPQPGQQIEVIVGKSSWGGVVVDAQPVSQPKS